MYTNVVETIEAIEFIDDKTYDTLKQNAITATIHVDNHVWS